MILSGVAVALELAAPFVNTCHHFHVCWVIGGTTRLWQALSGPEINPLGDDLDSV